MKAFGQKIQITSKGLIFHKGLGWPCLIRNGPQKALIKLKKKMFWVPKNLAKPKTKNGLL